MGLLFVQESCDLWQIPSLLLFLLYLHESFSLLAGVSVDGSSISDIK